MSTLSIAVTRPMKSPVSVTCRLTTGVTETAGIEVPCAAATLQHTIKMTVQIGVVLVKEFP